jgi:hypothetical protein
MSTIRLLDAMVRQNQDILEYLRHAHRIGDYSTKVGSLDYAISRINTIILRLCQHPLLADRYFTKLADCHDAVRQFHCNVKREETWPSLFKWYPRLRIHRIGIKRFPHIAKLLTQVENDINN